MTDLEGRERRVGEVIGAVARRLLADRDASRIALLDDGGPEAAFAARILGAALGPGAVVRVTAEEAEVESVLHGVRGVTPAEAAVELRRMRARLVPAALPANPANKTALLLGGELPPESFLPLGDLYAGEVAALAGGWSAPEAVRRVIDRAGGIEKVDDALRRIVDRRDPAGLEGVRPAAAKALRAALARGRASRVHPRVVPKLGGRTLGVDLFE